MAWVMEWLASLGVVILALESLGVVMALFWMEEEGVELSLGVPSGLWATERYWLRIWPHWPASWPGFGRRGMV